MNADPNLFDFLTLQLKGGLDKELSEDENRLCINAAIGFDFLYKKINDSASGLLVVDKSILGKVREFCENLDASSFVVHSYASALELGDDSVRIFDFIFLTDSSFICADNSPWAETLLFDQLAVVLDDNAPAVLRRYVLKMKKRYIFDCSLLGNTKCGFFTRGLYPRNQENKFSKFSSANEVDLIDNSALNERSSLVSKGQNNTVFIEGGARLRGVSITIDGDDNYIYVGAKSTVKGKLHIQGSGSSIIIGSSCHFSSGSARVFSQEDNVQIYIGDGCLLSRCFFRTSDSHSIICLDSRERINKASDITLLGRTWVGEDVKIMKGVKVARETVIATNSLVTKSLSDAYSVYAGTPAKKVRQNITWDIKRL